MIFSVDGVIQNAIDVQEDNFQVIPYVCFVLSRS
ncbi:hypothetical protein VPHD479_0123 [Vibrio phage D479]